jgi:hypothetical protein
MAGYAGEYGEGFLGIGYSQQSFIAKAKATSTATSTATATATATAPDGTDTDTVTNTDTAPMSTGIESPAITAAGENNISNSNNSSGYYQYQYQYQYGGENDSQPVFVAAQLRQDAELARLKAQDILRNILHGTGSGSAEHNKSNNDTDTDTDTGTTTTTTSSSSSAKNHHHNYYGPQDGLTNTDTAHVPSSTTTEIAPTQPSQMLPAQPSSSSIEKDAQTARLKAMDILRKFQSQPNESAEKSSNSAHLIPQHHHHHHHDYDYHHPQPPIPSQLQQPQSSMTSSLIPAAVPTMIPTVIPISVPIVTITPPWELAKRRRACLEKDEERKQRALFKNLQYVARLEEERLVQQLEEVKQVKTLEQQIDERYQQKMEHRQKQRSKNNSINNGSNNINTSGAGIGTKQRRKAEAKRQKTALPPSLRKNHAKGNRGGGNNNNSNGSGNNGSGSVAIYVSNLPTDGSFDEATIRGLFSAYGSLRKVHFYVDKITGNKKGDALVIYSLTEGEDEILLTESVCSQVGTYYSDEKRGRQQ